MSNIETNMANIVALMEELKLDHDYEIGKLKVELNLALDRIKDMLMADDGQAYKESERFYERHRGILYG